MKTTTVIIISLLLWSAAHVCGQNNVRLDYLMNRFQEFGVAHLQEKLFVHTDRDLYLAGESIWLKIYNVDGTFHRPLSINKLAYVDVLNPQGQIVVQAKIALVDGAGHGLINLPRELRTSEYSLRAYTRWMRNYDREFYFQKRISVVNAEQNPTLISTQQEQTSLAPDIQFFPEGGNLVQGTLNRVAFKIADSRGRGVSARGAIIDAKHDTVVRFKTHVFGMGSFEIIPSVDQKFSAVVFVANDVYKVELPRVNQNGYVMRVLPGPGDSLRVHVTYVGSGDPKVVFLLGHTRQMIRVMQSNAVNQGTAVFKMSTKQLADGISHLTVFDANQKPVCERLFFKRPERKLQIAASLSQKAFATRQLVKVDVTAAVSERPALANLSMSVFKVDSLQAGMNDISTYLYLTSDLKGYVQFPEYYLTGDGPEVAEAADNLMLTQGWRRFKWNDVFSDEIAKKKFSPEYYGVIASGRLRNAKTGVSVRNADLLLSRAGSTGDLYPSKTDENGRFQFAVKHLEQNNSLVITMLAAAAFSTQVDVDDPFDVTPYTYSSTKDGSNWLTSDLSDRFIHIQVSRSSVSNPTAEEKIALSPFYVNADVSYDLDDYVRFPSVEEIFREYVPEVIVRRQNRQTYLYMLNKDDGKFFTQRPLVLVDGLPVVDHGKVAIANTKSIQRVDVLARKYYHGELLHHGILNFHTLNKDLSGFELDSSSFAFDYSGASASREFYAPKYDRPEERASRLPDFRHVLTWVPNLKIQPGNTSSQVFYTSDVSGRFVGIIHGLTPDGVAGSYTFSFDVRPDVN